MKYIAKQIFFHFIIKNLVRLSPSVASKVLYRISTGKKLNLGNPQDFNEKLKYLMFNWQHPLIVTCTDRVKLRDYVQKKGLQKILVKLYGIFNEVDEIDFDKLPQQFTLKTNNACGTNIICHDKNKFFKKKILKKLKKWMKLNYSLLFAEMHYEKIDPKIICEEYIGSSEGNTPIDYKIYCFNGKPKVILLCIDRDIDKDNEIELKRFFLDLKWNKVDIGGSSLNYGEIPIPPPTCLDQMIYYAEQLSQGFPFVRVDFYEYKGEAKLGEMTFTPQGGMAGPDYYSKKGLKILGEMLELPEKQYFNF